MAGQEVYIVGGANSAGQAALHLARYARRVTLVVRAGVAGRRDVAVPGRGVEAAPNLQRPGGHGGRRRRR